MSKRTTARFEANGFVELRLSESDSIQLLQMMKARIRRITHLENAGPPDFAEVSRLARLCYSLASATKGMPVSVPHLSREDLEAMYVLPISNLDSFFLEALNEVRLKTRTGGPVDPVMADQMAKSLVEVMQD